jgi:enoyl-CoA hydratase/carnithine racemase
VNFETVLYEKQDDGILWIRFNRPQRLNAINCAYAREVVQALEAGAADPQVKVIILTGVGRGFCAGQDLKEALEGVAPEDEAKKIFNLQRIPSIIRDMNKVVIGAINGYAMGGGFEIALDCDLVIASDQAVFGFPETGVNETVTGGVTFLLPLAVGLAKAKELIFCGDRLDGKAACELGIVNKVVPHAELDAAALAMAKTILSKSALCIALSKSTLNSGAETNLSAALAYELDANAVAAAKADLVGAAKAFVEKRASAESR